MKPTRPTASTVSMLDNHRMPWPAPDTAEAMKPAVLSILPLRNNGANTELMRGTSPRCLDLRVGARRQELGHRLERVEENDPIPMPAAKIMAARDAYYW